MSYSRTDTEITINQYDISLIERYSTSGKQIKLALGDMGDINDFDEKVFEIIKDVKKVLEINNQIQSSSNDQTEQINVTETPSIYEEPNLLNETEVIVEKKFKIYSDENSMIQFPKNYSTDDEDLKLIADLMNETFDKGWKNVTDEKGVKVIKKNVGDNVPNIIKTTTIIEGFTKEEILEAMLNFDLRIKWDSMIREAHIIQKNEEENYDLTYFCIKPPVFFISARDFVQKRKFWENLTDEDNFLAHIKSVNLDDPKYKEKKEPVRGEMYLSGIYLKTISKNPHKVFYCYITQSHLNGNLSLSLINEKAPLRQVDNMIELKKGLKKVYNRK